ncbi:MAG: hypothetical protein QNJ98_00880 [Planctomycetota bacterium]|nr:hypothetical protein [Planctomycetota bacterium]
MLELRCPACECANGVTGEVDLDAIRCAACSAALDPDRFVRYRVDGEGRAWGNLLHRGLVMRATRGTLDRDMRISEEGGPWFRAGERLDLFARAPGPVTVTPSPRPRRVRQRQTVPPSVVTMAALGKLLGVALLLLAMAAFGVSASFDAGGLAVGTFVLFVGLGVGQIAVANRLLQRSATARNLQLLAATFAAVGYLLVVADGADGFFVLLGGGFVAIPFLLLLPQEVRAWFAGDDA